MFFMKDWGEVVRWKIQKNDAISSLLVSVSLPNICKHLNKSNTNLLVRIELPRQPVLLMTQILNTWYDESAESRYSNQIQFPLEKINIDAE